MNSQLQDYETSSSFTDLRQAVARVSQRLSAFLIAALQILLGINAGYGATSNVRTCQDILVFPFPVVE